MTYDQCVAVRPARVLYSPSHLSRSAYLDTQRMQDNPGGFWKWLMYSSLCIAADALDKVLSTVTSNDKPQANLPHSDIDEPDDQEILKIFKNGPQIHPAYPAVIQITPLTVAKPSAAIESGGLDSIEANALNLVRAKTAIPVPRVLRVVKDGRSFLVVMDYITGPTLDEVWPTYSIWKKAYVAFTLRRYVRQLRGIKASPATPPGPPSVQGPQSCESAIFGVYSRRGPFTSYAELSAFFNKHYQMSMDFQKVPDSDLSRKDLYDESSPLVFTHQDINPRNIIVGEDGQLWLIDWSWAGFYPAWFEYMAMKIQLENKESLGYDLYLWGTFIPFICGPCFREERWWWRMAPGLYFYG